MPGVWKESGRKEIAAPHRKTSSIDVSANQLVQSAVTEYLRKTSDQSAMLIRRAKAEGKLVEIESATR
jgi:hypothetical protein